MVLFYVNMSYYYAPTISCDSLTPQFRPSDENARFAATAKSFFDLYTSKNLSTRAADDKAYDPRWTSEYRVIPESDGLALRLESNHSGLFISVQGTGIQIQVNKGSLVGEANILNACKQAAKYGAKALARAKELGTLGSEPTRFLNRDQLTAAANPPPTQQASTSPAATTTQASAETSNSPALAIDAEERDLIARMAEVFHEFWLSQQGKNTNPNWTKNHRSIRGIQLRLVSDYVKGLVVHANKAIVQVAEPITRPSINDAITNAYSQAKTRSLAAAKKPWHEPGLTQLDEAPTKLIEKAVTKLFAFMQSHHAGKASSEESAYEKIPGTNIELRVTHGLDGYKIESKTGGVALPLLLDPPKGQELSELVKNRFTYICTEVFLRALNPDLRQELAALESPQP